MKRERTRKGNVWVSVYVDIECGTTNTEESVLYHKRSKCNYAKLPRYDFFFRIGDIIGCALPYEKTASLHLEKCKWTEPNMMNELPRSLEHLHASIYFKIPFPNVHVRSIIIFCNAHPLKISFIFFVYVFSSNRNQPTKW